jgi:FHA domain
VDSVIAILEKFSWPLATVVIVVILAIILRRRLADLIAGTTSIEIDPKKRKWQFKFGEQVRREQKKATMIPRHVTAASPLPPPLPASSGSQPTGRDMVLDAWGAVKQAVFDGCIANRIPVTPALSVSEARRRLADTRKLNADLVGLVDLVYELGREVAADSRLRPREDDARAYRTLAYSAAYWLAESVLLPPEAPPAPGPPERRPTMVGGNLAPASPGSAGAVLVAVGGPMKGQRYPINKSNYRVGRNPSNDLCAAADDSVSSNHASLRYENGGLFVYDQGSLNGTFLNEQRVSGTPAMVRQGDRIRLGESVFEVAGAAPDSRSGGAKEGPNKRPSDPTKIS